MVHAALLLLMLEAVTTDLVFTISLKRSTQNLQLSTSSQADYPIFASESSVKADIQNRQLGAKSRLGYPFRFASGERLLLKRLVDGRARRCPRRSAALVRLSIFRGLASWGGGHIAASALGGALAMLTALVLICSTSITPNLRDCTRDNAAAVMLLPVQSGNPATCFLHGQAYLAQTSIGQELGAKRPGQGRLCPKRNGRCRPPQAEGQTIAAERPKHFF
jgi:hypothetical protein